MTRPGAACEGKDDATLRRSWRSAECCIRSVSAIVWTLNPNVRFVAVAISSSSALRWWSSLTVVSGTVAHSTPRCRRITLSGGARNSKAISSVIVETTSCCANGAGLCSDCGSTCPCQKPWLGSRQNWSASVQGVQTETRQAASSGCSSRLHSPDRCMRLRRLVGRALGLQGTSLQLRERMVGVKGVFVRV
jgi:hypothetical protein